MAKGNWRDELGRDMRRIVKDKGIGAFLDVAQEMLNVDARGDGKQKAQFVGEVCEIVNMELTKQYLALSGNKGTIFQSCVLHDLKNPKSDFRTELDTVLVTPYFLLTSECKSYSGELVITGQGTFTHRGMEADVYKQSLLHHTHLMRYGEQLTMPELKLPKPPVFANAFVFSNAKIIDKRSREAEARLRVVTTSELIAYLDAMFKKYNKPVFDYERAVKIFGIYGVRGGRECCGRKIG